jgi:hypothetical protein
MVGYPEAIHLANCLGVPRGQHIPNQASVAFPWGRAVHARPPMLTTPVGVNAAVANRSCTANGQAILRSPA